MASARIAQTFAWARITARLASSDNIKQNEKRGVKRLGLPCLLQRRPRISGLRAPPVLACLLRPAVLAGNGKDGRRSQRFSKGISTMRGKTLGLLCLYLTFLSVVASTGEAQKASPIIGRWDL